MTSFLLATFLLWYMLTWSFTFCFQSKLLVRKIHSKPNNVTHALDILNQMDTTNPSKNIKVKEKDMKNVAVAAIRVCGNANNPDLGLELYNNYQSEATRAVAISVLGSCNQIKRAVRLLEDDFCPPSTASFNAAIACCGRNGKWQLALDIYRNKIPKQMISTVSTNALLTVLAKCRQGKYSLEILQSIVPASDPKTGSNSVTYTLVISALVRSNMLAEASQILHDLQNRHNYCSPKSIEAMHDLVIAAYSQKADWSGVRRVEQIWNKNKIGFNDGTNMTSSTESIESGYRFDQWSGLEKLGKGKESYWVLGTYDNMDGLNITIGCRPHRNPSRNGIQILFFENNFDVEISSWRQKKIGFLLMKNNWRERSSSLLGMFLKPNQRGRGMAKVCLSVWIWLSLKGSVIPETGIIRKPLLALILQHTFGFVDSTKNSGGCSGNLVELSQDPDDPKCVILYSVSGKNLEGALSFSDMKHQNIKITSHQPLKRGRLIRIGTRLYSPSDGTKLQAICNENLSRNFWKCNLSSEEIQRIFFGKTLE